MIVASVTTFLALTVAYDAARTEFEGVIAAIALPALAAVLQRRGQAPAWILLSPGCAFTLAAAGARMAGLQSLALTELWCLQVLTSQTWPACSGPALAGRAAA